MIPILWQNFHLYLSINYTYYILLYVFFYGIISLAANGEKLSTLYATICKAKQDDSNVI